MNSEMHSPGTSFAANIEALRTGDQDVADAVADLRLQLTDEEMLWLLDGDLALWRGFAGMAKRYNAVPFEAGRIDRLGIPGIRFTDGPRGVVVGRSTAFPVAIARAASFDPDLERDIGAAIGAEARAAGANLFAGICVNLAYSPGWGRAQESYGEDPLLLGAMGAALTEGVQPWVMACVKHYALNSMEEARFRVDVRVQEQVLHEVYLPHFRTIIEAGVDSVMSAYNSVNGTWAGDSEHLLTKILRHDWGFDGFVMTDFIWGLRDPIGSVAAGQDLEMPMRQQRAAALPAALRDGRLDRAAVERSADRLLAAQVKFALRAQPTPSVSVVASRAHRALAQAAACRGAVLLRNEVLDGTPMLPLDESTLSHIAVLGSLADEPNQGDVGSSQVFAPSGVSVVTGLRARLGDRVVHVPADARPAWTAAAARTADAAVIVVGLTSVDEGESLIGVDTEATRLFGGIMRWRPAAAVMARLLTLFAERQKWGGDRRDLRLHADDVALIQSVAKVNPRTIVVVIGGGTIVVDPWDQRVAALLLAWYPGMEGGHAIADMLLGNAEPSGRLPVAIPHRRDDLPIVDWDATSVTYDRWWGQRKLDHDGVAAAYPLGFGLGYSQFGLRALSIGPLVDETFPAQVTVTNVGGRAGRHVIQVYAHMPGQQRPVRVLVGFQSVALESRETRAVEITCSVRPLQRWTSRGFVTDPATVTVETSAFSGDPQALAGVLHVGS